MLAAVCLCHTDDQLQRILDNPLPTSNTYVRAECDSCAATVQQPE
jgi:hypothetical protein